MTYPAEHGAGHDLSCICWRTRPGCKCYLWDQDCPDYTPLEEGESVDG